MSVVVLGGSGFLGRALLARLAAAGHETSAVVRSDAAAAKIAAASPNTRTLREDDARGRRFDGLVNMVVDYGRGGGSLASLFETNVLYALRLAEAIDCGAVINVSSALPEAYSHYAHTKRTLERSLGYLGPRLGRQVLNLRLHNFYGPGADASNFVTFVAGHLLRAEPLELGDGENARDFLHIDDLTAALARIIERLGDLSDRDTMEVGSGRAIKLRDLVLLVQQMTGSNTPIAFGARPGNPHEPVELVADMSGLERVGWKARIGLEEGLRGTVNSLKR